MNEERPSLLPSDIGCGWIILAMVIIEGIVRIIEALHPAVKP